MSDWRSFQRRALDLFNSCPGFDARENVRLRGARGTVKVDIHVKHTYGPLNFSIIVECKQWNSRVTQEKVFALKSVVDDCGASLGIMLTQKGLQPGATTFIASCTNLIAYRIDELEMELRRSIRYVSGLETLDQLVSNPKTTERELQRMIERNPNLLSGVSLRTTGLEVLVNESRVSESAIGNFLASNPDLLFNLGYERAVFAPRIGRGANLLIPDVVLKPVGSALCDIMEFRSPALKHMINRTGQQRAAAALHEATAHLYAYAKCFEEASIRHDFQKATGLYCYMPRLLLLAGRSTGTIEEEMNLRRIERSLMNVSIITFDRVIEAARRRMLDGFL